MIVQCLLLVSSWIRNALLMYKLSESLDLGMIAYGIIL